MAEPLKVFTLSILSAFIASVTFAQQIGTVGDWPDWRGPDRDGISKEKGLPEKWSLAGQNLAWKAPYGGRSTPVVLGDHLYLQNTAELRSNRAGARAVLQRRHRQGALGI